MSSILRLGGYIIVEAKLAIGGKKMSEERLIPREFGQRWKTKKELIEDTEYLERENAKLEKSKSIWLKVAAGLIIAISLLGCFYAMGREDTSSIANQAYYKGYSDAREVYRGGIGIADLSGAYMDGYTEGREDGYEEGYEQGGEEGYTQGFEDARLEFYQDYQEGYEDAYKEIYGKKYKDYL
jgi:hypothetical protein